MGLRCIHAFDTLSIHANGDAVCSIIDGRGSFVLGNVHSQSIGGIFLGDRARELRRLVLSSPGAFCPAVGLDCPLKTMEAEPGGEPPVRLRCLQIEPTTDCDLRCLACLVRDLSGDVGWLDAWRDGGAAFLVWDGLRRAKQHAVDALRWLPPSRGGRPPAGSGALAASLGRGRVPKSRAGTLPLEVIERVVEEAGPGVERIDFFNYGEPFLYRHLLDALRHIRRNLPGAQVIVSTSGRHVREDVRDAITDEGLVDWLVFSIDGCDAESYRRYRVRGDFDASYSNLVRFVERARGTRVHVIWQYVVFRWNDRDEQLRRAIDMAGEIGVPIQFDFSGTWGRSRRSALGLEHLRPFLRPNSVLPGERRRDGL